MPLTEMDLPHGKRFESPGQVVPLNKHPENANEALQILSQQTANQALQFRVTVFETVPGKFSFPTITYFSAEQMVDGLPVEGSLLRATFSEGKLLTLHGNVFPEVAESSLQQRTTPDGEVATARVVSVSNWGAKASFVTKAKWVFLNQTWRRVQEVSKPGEEDRYLVSHLQIWRQRNVLDVAPQVSGQAVGRGVFMNPLVTGNNLNVLPLSFLTLNQTGGAPTQSDLFGNFLLSSASFPTTASASLAQGAFVQVQNLQGATLSFSQTFSAPSSSAQILFNPTGNQEFDTAQVNAFFHVNLVRYWLETQGIQPAGIHQAIPARVNDPANICNALYNPGSAPALIFGVGSTNPLSSCANAAMDTLIHHEYGHFVDDQIGGITDAGLSEGWGDTLPAFLTGQPLLAEGFYPTSAQTYIRSADNQISYPISGRGENHFLGQSFSGFAWELRQNAVNLLGNDLGSSVANFLVLPSLFANAPSIPEAVLEVFRRADDDGNLANGTPYYLELARPASKHGFSFWLPIKPEFSTDNPTFAIPGQSLVKTGIDLKVLGGTPQDQAFIDQQVVATSTWSAQQISLSIPQAATSGWLRLVSNGVGSVGQYLNVLRTTISSMYHIAGSKNGFSGDGELAGSEFVLFENPTDVEALADGSILIVDRQNNRLRKKLANGHVATIAGTGVAGSTGDGGPALQAQINTPCAVAADAQGNLFLTESLGHRVRKIDPSGVITTLAGGNGAGSFGDGGPAIFAQLNAPCGIAVDSSGVVFISDTGNHRVRQVNTNGTISTIAGTGVAGFSGDLGAATAAQINQPQKIQLFQGNLFIADGLNHRIRKINPAGIISTVAGTGVGGFSGDLGAATAAQIRNPNDFAFDLQGNLFFSDAGNRRIRKINPQGIISTVAGSGALIGSGRFGEAALSGQISFPQGISRMPNGDFVFIHSSLGNFADSDIRGLHPQPPILDQASICSQVGTVYTLCVSGKHFGATQAEGQSTVLINGTALNPSHWASEKFEVQITSSSLPTGTVQVWVGGFESKVKPF